MQPVGGGQVARAKSRAPNRIRVLTDRSDMGGDQVDARCTDAASTRALCSAVRRTPRPGPARNGASTRARRVQIGDSPKGLAGQRDSECVQLPHGVGHHALTAGLVDRRAAPLDDGHRQPGPRGVQCGDQTGRPAARDQEIDHDRLARAAFSVRMRVRNRAALSTVKTSAVIHPVCTRGRAMPSAMTAT